MRSRLVIAGLLAITAAAAACNDATGPKSTQHVATIMNIRVPASAAVTDTVKVAFNYATNPCDTGVVLQVRNVNDGVRFTVTSWSTQRPCPLELSIYGYPSIGYLVNPPHTAPLRLTFSEPDGQDSVRLVAQ